MNFEWDSRKNTENIRLHSVSFEEAKQAFFDKKRILLIDVKHGMPLETRFFCLGKAGGRILTVRFTMRENTIRIFGAGYWRKGRKRYEKEYGVY